MIRRRIACRVAACGMPLHRWPAQTSPSSAAWSRNGDGVEPIQGGTVVDPQRTDRRRRRVRRVPAGAQVIDAHRQMGDAGHRRRLLAARPGRSRSCRAERASRRHRQPANGPVQRRDRRRPGDQSADHDDRRQSRRRRDPCDRRAGRRQEHLRRPGRGDRHRRRHGADHRARGFQFVELGETGADNAGGSAPRRMSCSATPCARRRSSALCRCRSGQLGTPRRA